MLLSEWYIFMDPCYGPVYGLNLKPLMCDAILSPSFYKQGKGGQVFKIGSRALVYFHIPNNIYEAYDQWCEKQEYNRLVQDVSSLSQFFLVVKF